MAAIQNGARVLDEYFAGEPWWERLDPDMPNIEYAGQYILGQLFGSFELGLAALKIDPRQSDTFGFSADNKVDEGYLTYWWREFLYLRKQGEL